MIGTIGCGRSEWNGQECPHHSRNISDWISNGCWSEDQHVSPGDAMGVDKTKGGMSSARVLGALTIDSGICVATTTGFPARQQACKILLLRPWTPLRSKVGAEIPARDHNSIATIDDDV
ncbi:hypothetical protein [Bradyrhizobium zhanjiangense]|uniref:hypothetical protein n=1 Tax=Bradyrhizobium zhanjiangense TaxID=1325107 RepID=UPI001FE02545|nr:hypothetical protein [Bradyrhizobium zhanjiangense]